MMQNAIVAGQQLTEFPEDLYIPPDAMRVILEVFEGPLDLLLYLIRKHNLDILDIPVALITHQYVEYIELMHYTQLELVGEYLEMAALLAEIKSRMLLPKPKNEDAEEVDPRAELVRRLQEYEQIKSAAENMSTLPRLGSDMFASSASLPDLSTVKAHPDVDLRELLYAFKDVLKRADLQTAHNIEREILTVRERMSRILRQLQTDKFVNFVDLFDFSEGRLGLVVTFLAILELTREWVLELVQSESFAPIYVRLRNHEH
ncbi:MAG TPA: segregation/condensation protein A [Gammaproteobacteria bacterium]|nr:segregation/condensation protein A [Gammaproteobacteria bacterium]